MQVRSHLHPAERHVDDLLRSQAGRGTEHDTAAAERLTVDLQQSSTGPRKSESQKGEYFTQMKYYIRKDN